MRCLARDDQRLARRPRGGRTLWFGPAGALALAMSLAACGGSSSATDGTPAGSAATAGAAPSSASAASAAGGDGARAGSINVCSLLSKADAIAIAKKFKLASDPGASYKLMTQKQKPPTTSYPSSACEFTIAEVTSDNTGPEAIVFVGVFPAKYLDKTGKKISGLGDEAYDEGQYVEVRVGDLMMQSNENQGASKDFINAMYRAMAPSLR